jgi:hypothetical protein
MTWNHNKMEQLRMQHEKTITNLEQIRYDQKKQPILTNIDMEK